jgi:hypothetical protein
MEKGIRHQPILVGIQVCILTEMWGSNSKFLKKKKKKERKKKKKEIPPHLVGSSFLCKFSSCFLPPCFKPNPLGSGVHFNRKEGALSPLSTTPETLKRKKKKSGSLLVDYSRLISSSP